MPKLSREGHRERLRQSYIDGGMKNAPDHNLLELFLTGIIPRKDVKPLSYEILNYFGTLESVINATPQQLMEVKGVGEATAIQISLIKTIYKRVMSNRNNNLKVLLSLNSATEFCKNLLSEEIIEKAYLITLDGNYRIIGNYCVGNGGIDETYIDRKTLIAHIIRDKARFVYFTHNHPNAKADPSAADLNFTVELKKILTDLKVILLEHIVIGNNTCSYIIEDYLNSPKYKFTANEINIK